MTHYINQIKYKYCNIGKATKKLCKKISTPKEVLKNTVIFLFYTHSINSTCNTLLYEFCKLPINYW